MKIKFNKKILTNLGLSCLLLTPLVLSSCGDGAVIETPKLLMSDYYEIGNEGRKLDYLYEIFGSQIYYKDNNDLWTLDLSKFTNVEDIDYFAFGSFEKEINRLILPPNLTYMSYNALYPNTSNGFLYAKNGINPMFKVVNKKNQKIMAINIILI